MFNYHSRFNTLAGSTVRNCEPCGTNVIPYPLSTGPNCGDPMYIAFTATIPQASLASRHSLAPIESMSSIQVNKNLSYKSNMQIIVMLENLEEISGLMIPCHLE